MSAESAEDVREALQEPSSESNALNLLDAKFSTDGKFVLVVNRDPGSQREGQTRTSETPG